MNFFELMQSYTRWGRWLPAKAQAIKQWVGHNNELEASFYTLTQKISEFIQPSTRDLAISQIRKRFDEVGSQRLQAWVDDLAKNKNIHSFRAQDYFSQQGIEHIVLDGLTELVFQQNPITLMSVPETLHMDFDVLEDMRHKIRILLHQSQFGADSFKLALKTYIFSNKEKLLASSIPEQLSMKDSLSRNLLLISQFNAEAFS